LPSRHAITIRDVVAGQKTHPVGTSEALDDEAIGDLLLVRPGRAGFQRFDRGACFTGNINLGIENRDRAAPWLGRAMRRTPRPFGRGYVQGPS
jgi:hypothetical protein